VVGEGEWGTDAGGRMSWSDIPGRAAYLWIYDEWIASSPRQGAVVVEVGVALGKSLAYLCEKLRDAGRDDIVVYAVDAWGGYARNGEQTSLADAAGGDFTLYCKTLLEHSPYTLERARVTRERSDEYLLAHNADLIVLDADHVKEQVLKDIHQAWENSHDHGWLGGDDYMPEYQGVIDAVTEAFPEGVEVRYDQGWGSWLKR
jgi:cephalosporin hydroxylase